MARDRRYDGPTPVQDLAAFDYGAAAELFGGGGRKPGTGNKGFVYNRFENAAEALRFAVEIAPAPAMLGAYLEVDEARFDLAQIRLLYDNTRYPLQRRADTGVDAGGETRKKTDTGKMATIARPIR